MGGEWQASFPGAGQVHPYAEIFGELKASSARREPPPSSLAVYSELTRGAVMARPLPGVCLKYVAEGVELHRIGERTFPVAAGEWLFLPEGYESEIEVRSAGAATVGLCLYLSSPGAERALVERPIVFSARTTALGGLLANQTLALHRAGARRAALANDLLDHVQGHLTAFLADTALQLDALDAVKPGTRAELLRRLDRARGYLHEVTDRSVPLTELGAVAGLSRFHLLRHFAACFGEPPASYHRRIRVELARTAVVTQRLSVRDAAQKFGFADSSSLAKAERRTKTQFRTARDAHGALPTADGA